MKNLMQRMAGVMADVAYLTKDDRVDAGAGKSYKAITEEKVTSVVRQAMLKHGIVLYPTSQTTSITSEVVQTKNGERINRVTHVDVVYHMVNVDDPADFIEVASSGTGVDSQDKGVGKAMTYAYKYALLRSFAIPTGDDPDKIASDVYSDKLYGDPSPKADAPKTGLSVSAMRKILVDLADGDEGRVRKFAESLYAKKGMIVKFDDLDIDQLTEVKVQISKRLGLADA